MLNSPNAFKIALKRAIQKRAEATDDLTGNEIVNKITKISRALPHNSSVTLIKKNAKRWIWHKIIDDLRLI